MITRDSQIDFHISKSLGPGGQMPISKTNVDFTVNVTLDIGQQDSDSFTVGIIVGGRYTRDSSEDNKGWAL